MAQRTAEAWQQYRQASGGMKRTGVGSDAHKCEERPVSRARRDSPVGPVQTTTKDTTRAVEFASHVSVPALNRNRFDSDDCIVVRDGSHECCQLAEASLSSLVCTKCTFENPRALLATMPPPVLCPMCEHPLQHADIISNSNTYTEQRGFAERASAADASLQMTHYNGANKDKVSNSISQLQITPEGFLLTEDDAPGVTCPACTLFVAGVGATRCPVCTAPLKGNSSVPGMSRCAVCTLWNVPRATVCSSCEIPLAGGEHAPRDQSRVVSVSLWDTEESHRKRKKQAIAAASELKTRTVEAGGDKQAFTDSLLPQIDHRLSAQYQSTKQNRHRGDWKRHGRRIVAASAENSAPKLLPGGGRGALSWLSSAREVANPGGARGRGTGNDRSELGPGGRAEWKLCNSSTAHCSQRGAAGSGYSCGYRNIQMLCSALMEFPEYRRVLFGGSGCIPGIFLLQSWLERAWADGYDPEGCEQLGGAGSLLGSEKWIGATECATLLRSFGVKAEVIDFETEASVRARSRCAKGADPSARENSRLNDNVQINNHTLKSTAPQQLAEADKGRQRSILSFWGAQPGDKTLGSAKISGSVINSSTRDGNIVNASNDSLTAVRRHVAGSLQVNDDVISTVDTEDNASLLGGDKTRTDKNITVPPTYIGQEFVPEALRSSTKRSSSSRGLTGGRGNGHLAGSNDDSGVRATAGGSGHRAGGEWCGYRGRGRERGKGKNSHNASAGGGVGCGHAVLEWAWEYFSTPWNTEKVSTATDKRQQSQTGSLTERTSALECFGMDQRPRPARTRGESLCAWDDGGGTGADFSQSSATCDTADSRGDGDGSLAHDSEKDEQRQCGEGNPSFPARLPPPLYLQHDGHSRTVVGVLWPDIRSRAGHGGGVGVGRGGVNSARRAGGSIAGHEGAGGRPGSLLVFDPSHSGLEIRDALANGDTMRWCSLLKRGAQSLQRQQFQMVAVRPGLLEPSDADSWKKIMSTKVCIR